MSYYKLYPNILLLVSNQSIYHFLNRNNIAHFTYSAYLHTLRIHYNNSNNEILDNNKITSLGNKW